MYHGDSVWQLLFVIGIVFTNAKKKKKNSFSAMRGKNVQSGCNWYSIIQLSNAELHFGWLTHAAPSWSPHISRCREIKVSPAKKRGSLVAPFESEQTVDCLTPIFSAISV